jgi:iron complex outermembrane recepter protein
MLQKKPLTMAVRAALGLTTAVLAMPMLAQAQGAASLEEVVVTGSRIQKANLVSSSPVTQLDAEQLKMSGITRLEDVLKDLPQIYQTQGTGQSNGATGTATINLRNLGDNRTLVLVDGKRMPQGSPIQGGDGADINQIPGALVKRVEVLTGGASATYGSDAVAGVVNFIMIDDFEGVSLDYQFSRYRHDNDGNWIADRAEARGFGAQSGSISDGDISDMSLIIGGNLNEGRGNVVAYATYRNIEALLQSERDYSACSPNGSNTGCGGSGTHDKGRFTDFATYDFRVEGNEFVPNAGYAYNFGPLNYWQRPDERYTAGAFANYEINKHVDVYTQLMFMDDQSVSQIAPSGAFFVTSTIPCGNPFLSAQQFGALGCTDPTDVIDGYIGRRNVEGGGRQQDLRHTSLRGVFGIRGQIDDIWRYDLSGQYSEVSMENTYLNDFSTSRIGRALDVTVDARGRPVCRSVLDGSDPSCVPWNVFQAGGVTQAALDYLQLPLFARGTTDQTVIGGYVAANLAEYGLKLPSAETGIDVVFGFEWRQENLEFNPDRGFIDGEGAGQGGPTLPVDGGYEVGEWYAEAIVPLVEGAAFAEAVNLELGYRYSDYDTDQTTDTWKVAGNWVVNQQFTARGSFQRAVRAANLRELYQPRGLNLFDMAQDPCGGAIGANGLTAAGYSFDQCARSGVTATSWGTVPDSPAGQYNYIQGGDRNLKPEESDTISFGVIITPDFVDGLSLTIDYYDIEVTDAIDNRGGEYILTQCIETGAASFCDLVNRGANGNLWVGSASVTDTNFNTGFFQVKGWDIATDYQFDIGSWGSVALNNTMGIIDSWEQQQTPGGTVDSCEGKWGGTCGYPTPDFRNVFRANWTTPWDVMLSVSWRHIGEVQDLVTTAAAIDLDSVNYFDLSGVWNVNDNASIRAGINNLFDEAPPIAGFNAGAGIYGNGNTFPGLYDALGQYMFVGGTISF